MNKKMPCMDRLSEWIAAHKYRSLVGLGLIFVVCALTSFNWPLISTATTVVSYFFFGLIIFSISKPGKSDASMIFLLVILAAIIYITIFGSIYSNSKLIRSTDKDCNVFEYDYFYYSAVVFTSLGFGDYLPNSWAGKLITSVQALLGLAYNSTILILILGRSQWLVDESKHVEKAEDAQISNTSSSNLAQQIAALECRLAHERVPHTFRPLHLNKKYLSVIGWASIVALVILITSTR